MLFRNVNCRQCKKCETKPSSTVFEFGNRQHVKLQKLMQIASIVDIQKIYIETDVVDCKVPLLLSKVAMKKAEINIDFAVDCHNFWITLGNHFGDLHEMDPVRKITWF